MSKFDRNFNAQSAVFAECISNSKQIFQLINSILPVESCLSYEVMPLELEGKNLVVGMLDPANQNSLNYLRPLATSFGYELNLKLIDSQTHQLILAAYLKNPLPAQTPKRDWKQTIVDTAPQPPFSKEDWNKTIVDTAPQLPFNKEDWKQTIVDTAPKPPFNKEDWNKTIVDTAPQPPFNKEDWNKTIVDTAPQPSFNKEDWNKTIVDTAPQPPFNKEDWNKTIVDTAPTPPLEDHPIKRKSAVDASMTLTEIPEDFDFALNLVAQTKNNEFDDAQIEQSEIISSEPQISQLISETAKDRENDLSFDLDEDLSFLNLKAESTIASTDFLPQLTTNISWQELLEKTLNSELDCLELNRQSDFGTIIVSQDGEVKSTREKIRLPIFDALIEEIKLAAKLPLKPLKSTKKVVMERFHRQKRVLLRLEFMLTLQGEAVKIQILRDRALKLYEQKQMDKMSEEVFSLAQKLEQALKQMQVCFSSAKLNNLQDLQAINQEIERQLQLLDKR